jgi:hypothetical protein
VGRSRTTCAAQRRKSCLGGHTAVRWRPNLAPLSRHDSTTAFLLRLHELLARPAGRAEHQCGARLAGPPTAAVAKKLEKVLLGEVERLEKKELAATPAGNPDYISSSAAKQDLANYFNSYAAPAKPAPKAERQETATESRQELDAFLDQGLKELVVHKPRPEDVFPDARPAVRAVSSGLARDVTRPGSGLADAEKRMEFREWQREAVGRRGPSLLARIGEEQRRQQLGADAAGRATAQQWGRRRERFYTDVRGPVTSSFRAWNPEVGSSARAGEAGETLVPDDEVAMA